MIKIEYVEGTGTVTLATGEESAIFPGMQVSAEELVTLEATGDVVYCIDETRIVVVPKGTKPIVISVTDSTAGTEVDVAGTDAEVPPDAELQASIDKANEEAAARAAAVVPPSVETPAPVAAKK